MKKEMLFKIGLVNKSSVQTIKDTTTFYTSDTELWLGFELLETELIFDSAEILLLNKDDSSFIVRSVKQEQGKYWYELESDIIAHHGEWLGQLQFNKDEEAFTSKKFGFRIENDLSNDRPPQLTDVANWETLRQSAKDLIAEMGDIVSNEAARIEAEKQRQETLQKFATFEDGNFLSPNSITPDKISPDNADYIDMYDKTTNTDGFFVNISGGGNLIANANFSASDFYPIEKDKTYEFFNADGNGAPLYPPFALYDINKVYIYISDYISISSATDTTTRFIAPNDGFVRFSIRKPNVDIAFFRKVIETTSKKLNWLSVDESNLTTELLEKVNSIGSTPTPVASSAEYSHSLAKPFNFNGKSSVWFGDSITYGMSSPDVNTPSLHYTANGYVKLFSDSVGMSNVNRAISGTTFADTVDTNSILNRILAYTTPKDFVFVAGGTNDHSLNKPLGALGDTTGETVYGALHVICQHFKTNYATSQVVFITPTEKTRDYPNQVAPLDSYRKAIYEMAVINGYSVVDGRKIGFPSGKGAFADLLISDGVHPSELGHEHYAKTLQGILN